MRVIYIAHKNVKQTHRRSHKWVIAYRQNAW